MTARWCAHGEANKVRAPKTAETRHFLHLARGLQNSRQGGASTNRRTKGVTTMTFTTLQNTAFSLAAALMTATLFVTAAVGPAVPLV